MKISTIMALVVLLASCSSQGKRDVENAEFDFGQFDYIDGIDVRMTFNDVLSLLPSDKKMVSDADIGMVYSWVRGKVSHELSVFFYGYDYYTELRVELDFSEDVENAEPTMWFLHKKLENKYGAPYNYINSEEDELVQWKEVRMDGENIITLFFDRTNNLIKFESNILDTEDLGFENGTEGEWVQRGPDGEWVWMPNDSSN
jgi:hypothetical protein